MKMTKFTLAAALALTGAVVFQTTAGGAEDKSPAKPGQGRAAVMHDRMQDALKDLNLSDDQKEKLQDIFRGQMEKMRELRQDQSLSQQEKGEKMKALREEATPRIKEILSPAQFEKWRAKQGQLFGGQQHQPGGRMQDALNDLNLSDDQKQKMQEVFRTQMEKLRELRQDQSLSPKDKMDKMKALMDEATPKMKEILTPEQFEKWQQKRNQFGGGHQGTMQDRVQGAIKELNLTDDQKEKLKPLFEEQREKFTDIFLDSSSTLEQKIEKFKAMKKEIAPKMKEVLDAEQFEKWEKKSDEALEQFQKRGGPRKQQ